jgi:PAS domain S-box-containing protein
MTSSEIDYRAVFDALPGALALLAPDLVILDVNRDYLEVTGRTGEELIGRDIFEAFPANPAVNDRDMQRDLRVSLETVLATGIRDATGTKRYDLEVPGHAGEFEERYWAVVNAPVLGPGGEVALITETTGEQSVTRAYALLVSWSGPASDPEQAIRSQRERWLRARRLNRLRPPGRTSAPPPDRQALALCAASERGRGVCRASRAAAALPQAQRGSPPVPGRRRARTFRSSSAGRVGADSQFWGDCDAF